MMRRWLRIPSVVALALGIGGAVFVIASCGDGEADAPGGASDAAPEALLVGDAEPPTPDAADVPPGEVCGDRGGFQPSAQWPVRGGCPTRANWSALVGPRNGTVRPMLSAPTGDTSPVVAAVGTIWIGAADGNVIGVLNGIPRWGLATGAAVRSSAAIDRDGVAVVGGANGFLYGLKDADGPIGDGGADGGDAGAVYPPVTVVFAIPVGAIASSPVIGADGTIYVGTLDGRLVAIAHGGSATKWSVTTDDTLGSSPALGQDGTIYVGSSNHKIHAIAPQDGAIRWALDVGAEINGSPAVGGDGTIYIGSSDGKLHAITRQGVERWSYATGGAITGTPAVYAGTVYVGSEDKKLHAVATTTGVGRWVYATLGAVGTPLIAADGMVYVGSADGNVYAITPKGFLFFASNVKGKVKGALALGVGPAIYAATDKGVVAIGP